MSYNQAADQLYNVRAWWYSLSTKDCCNPDKFSSLVDRCEATIRSENTSWLKDMQDRLAHLDNLRESKSSEERKNDEKYESHKDREIV